MTVTEETVGVNSERSELVSTLLEEVMEHDDYGEPSIYTWFVMSLEEIYEDNLQSQDDKLETEAEDDTLALYVSDLEAIIWGLINQRALLVNVLHRIQEASYTRDLKDPFSVLGLETLKKMLLYCITGRDYAMSDHAAKFYQTEQFQAACNVHPLLPVEWQDRAAKFIELYASRYFETEFATSPSTK